MCVFKTCKYIWIRCIKQLRCVGKKHFIDCKIRKLKKTTTPIPKSGLPWSDLNTERTFPMKSKGTEESEVLYYFMPHSQVDVKSDMTA